MSRGIAPQGAIALTLLAIVGAAACSGGTTTAAEELGTEPESVGSVSSALNGVTWNLIWNDEFDSGSLDRSKWVPSDWRINQGQNSGSCYNNESASYMDNEGCGSGTSTICQYNGYLHLVSRYAPNISTACGYNQNYVSSRMTTKTKFHVNPGMGNQGVRIEGRINFPAMTAGIFPAFWMLGANIAQWPSPGNTYWPQAGEIDIAEWGSAWSGNQSLATMHYSYQDPSTYDGQYHSQIGSFYSAGMTSNAFHTYAVEWSWGTVKYFVDGAQVGPTVDLNATASQDFNHDFAIILNNAVGGPGGGYAGIDPVLVPQSTTAAGGFTNQQRMAVDYVRVYALNNDGGWMARPFQGTGQYNAALPTEWDYGYYKADCGKDAALTGLSANVSGGAPHDLLCTNHGTQFTGSGVTTLTDMATGDHRRYSRAGDWDSGHYKSECGTNEYVSGISQAPGSGNVDGLRCASASMTSNGTANCETRNVGGGDDRGNTSTGDWDSSYYKSECGANKVVVGVSASTSTGKPHRILCCSK
jgi:beta-glucanase (GH16 family)